MKPKLVSIESPVLRSLIESHLERQAENQVVDLVWRQVGRQVRRSVERVFNLQTVAIKQDLENARD
jgi:hypothetical protein